MPSDRIVVSDECYFTDPRPGLGYLLYCAGIAWSFARRTDRTLVIDWTKTIFSEEGAPNLFEAVFSNRGQIAGVPLYTAPLSSLPGPVAPRDLPERELQGYATVFPFAFRRTKAMPDTRPFFENLTLLPAWAKYADEFAVDNFSGRFVIGAHVRHGNGEQGHFESTNRRIKNLPLFMENFARYVHEIYGLADTYIFLCTDSDCMTEAFGHQFAGRLLTRRQWRPAPDAGCALHHSEDHPDGPQGHAIDAAIDMMLLRRCDVPLALTPASTRRQNPNSHKGFSGFPMIANQTNENFRILIVEDEAESQPRFCEFDDAPIV